MFGGAGGEEAEGEVVEGAGLADEDEAGAGVVLEVVEGFGLVVAGDDEGEVEAGKAFDGEGELPVGEEAGGVTGDGPEDGFGVSIGEVGGESVESGGGGGWVAGGRVGGERERECRALGGRLDLRFFTGMAVWELHGQATGGRRRESGERKTF